MTRQHIDGSPCCDSECTVPSCPGPENARKLADYARLQGLVVSHEESVRGTVDVQERLALVDELANTLRGRCEWHHIPLFNNWCHTWTSNIGLRRTVRCRLTKEEMAILAKVPR